MMAAPFPLADWLREQGGTVTNLSWPIDFGDDGGRGVGLSSAVPKGSILLQVPSSAMFTPPVARALLVSAFPDSSYFKDEEECVGEQLLAAGLLCERRKGPSSRWAPWLASLPSPAEYATILDMWPESALPLLGSPRLLHRRARSLHRLRSGFEACSRAFGSPAELSFTFEDYCWAICSVRSRTFLADLGGSVFEADVAIVPFGDMFNHTPSDDCCVPKWAKRKRGAGASTDRDAVYTLKAHRAYAVGEQVCISYGDRANQDLLETYGFVLPGNPYDTCTLSLPQALTPEPGSVQYQLLTALASECMSADTDDSDPLASVTTVSLDDLPSSSAVVLAAFRIASSSPERTVGRSTSLASFRTAASAEEERAVRAAVLAQVAERQPELDDPRIAELETGGSVSEEYVRIARIYRQGQHNVLRAFVEAISDEREV